MTTLGRGGSDLDGHVARACSWRRECGALERRAGHPDGRSAYGRRRSPDPAAPSSRGRRSRALRRQGPASTRAHPNRGHAHRAARAVVRRSRSAGNGSLRAPVRPDASGQGAGDHSRAGGRHRGRQGHGRRARHRGAHVRRGGCANGCRCPRSSRPRPRARLGSRCRSRRPIARLRAIRRAFQDELPAA